jgi:predicted transcriptional regulator
VKPVPLRKLKAQMVMKDLSLRDVSRLANVPYGTTGNILNGLWVHPEYLRRIKKAIEEAPTPREAAPR